MTILPFLVLLLLPQGAPAITPVQLQVPELLSPIRQASPNTPAEVPVLREAIALFDQQKYDEALDRFDRILKANPNNVTAIYETAQTYWRKREFQKAIDFAAMGAQYASPALPTIYALIGNVLDDAGHPQRAIEVYKKGLALNMPNSGGVYLNMGVTQEMKLRDVPTAKTTFKQGLLVDPNLPGLHANLAGIYAAQGLKTPVLLAASRFLVLESNTPRSQAAYNNWRSMLDNRTPPPPPQGHPLYDYIRSPEQTSEGNQSELDAALVASKTAATREPNSQIQTLIDQVDHLFGAYASMSPGDSKDTFLWKYYIPYFIELKQKGFVEPFVYLLNQRTNLNGVREWLNANPDKVSTFLLWSRTYKWPDKDAVDPAR